MFSLSNTFNPVSVGTPAMVLFRCCRLRQIDLEFMRRMHRKVNIVPVIAKADTLTSAEIKRLKDRIMADVDDNKIQVYI